MGILEVLVNLILLITARDAVSIVCNLYVLLSAIFCCFALYKKDPNLAKYGWWLKLFAIFLCICAIIYVIIIWAVFLSDYGDLGTGILAFLLIVYLLSIVWYFLDAYFLRSVECYWIRLQKPQVNVVQGVQL